MGALVVGTRHPGRLNKEAVPLLYSIGLLVGHPKSPTYSTVLLNFLSVVIHHAYMQPKHRLFIRLTAVV
eukprot:Em0019g959a